MKKYFRKNPIGDHCFYNDTGIGLLMLYCAVLSLVTLAGVVFIDVMDLNPRIRVLYFAVATEVIMLVFLGFYYRNRFGLCVKAELSGVKICRNDEILAIYSWNTIHEIGYTSWKTDKGETQYTAFAAVRPLTGEEHFSIKLSNSLNDPKQKHSDSGWIFLCSGDLNRAKEAVEMMEKWKAEYAPYCR